MPKGLDINHTRQLHGTVPPYHDHILINTGTADWPSRIEKDERHPFASIIKSKVNQYHLDHPPSANTTLLVSNSSLGPSGASTGDLDNPSVSVFVAKAGLHVTLAQDTDSIEGFAADLLQYMEEGQHSKRIFHDKYRAKELDQAVVLICGHGNRDVRCGVMGPLLESEFNAKLVKKGFAARNHLNEPGSATEANGKSVLVGLISHVGGHALAGNVIIYIPSAGMFRDHPLAGKGVWYGRVEPSHVEGIVDKTLQDGIIIEELLRGIVG